MNLTFVFDGYLAPTPTPELFVFDGYLFTGVQPVVDTHAAKKPDGGHKKKDNLERYGVENYDDVMAVINAFLLCQN
jgi:hypothetical protein